MNRLLSSLVLFSSIFLSASADRETNSSNPTYYQSLCARFQGATVERLKREAHRLSENGHYTPEDLALAQRTAECMANPTLCDQRSKEIAESTQKYLFILDHEGIIDDAHVPLDQNKKRYMFNLINEKPENIKAIELLLSAFVNTI